MSDQKPTITLEQLQGAVGMRASAYAHVFDVLSERYDTETAVEVLGEATYRLGLEMGERFETFGPSDVRGLLTAFLAGIPGRDDLFQPEITKDETDGFEIRFHRCPLKDFWVANGRSETDVQNLCRAAGRIDAALFGRAGFVFKGETWSPGRNGCCILRVEPGPA